MGFMKLHNAESVYGRPSICTAIDLLGERNERLGITWASCSGLGVLIYYHFPSNIANTQLILLYNTFNSARDVVQAVQKRIVSRNANVQLYSLTVRFSFPFFFFFSLLRCPPCPRLLIKSIFLSLSLRSSPSPWSRTATSQFTTRFHRVPSPPHSPRSSRTELRTRVSASVFSS